MLICPGRERQPERRGIEGKKSEEVAEGREKEEGRLKSRENGSVSMATTVVYPPPVFPLLCRELWWSLCNAIPLECTVWISAEQCPQGSDRATVKTLLPRSNAVITQHRGGFRIHAR